MIFVTGDCHGDYRKLSSAAFREQKEMDRQDFVIVCGDFGYWDRSRQEETGGKVQMIRENVIHLMRGQMFNLQGRRFFTFGGARSHDIVDGILEPDDPELRVKVKRLEGAGALYRINHLTWWKEEMPSEQEYEEGRSCLEQNGWKCDYILSHCAPSSVQAQLSCGRFDTDPLTVYLEEIKNRCEYRKWFFGHYHEDELVDDRHMVLYHRIERVL